eukprot:Selendium_serpulae@DN4024_c0_g2_i1.p3
MYAAVRAKDPAVFDRLYEYYSGEGHPHEAALYYAAYYAPNYHGAATPATDAPTTGASVEPSATDGYDDEYEYEYEEEYEDDGGMYDLEEEDMVDIENDINGDEEELEEIDFDDVLDQFVPPLEDEAADSKDRKSLEGIAELDYTNTGAEQGEENRIKLKKKNKETYKIGGKKKPEAHDDFFDMPGGNSAKTSQKKLAKKTDKQTLKIKRKK